MNKLTKTSILSLVFAVSVLLIPSCKPALPQPTATSPLKPPTDTPKPIFTPTVRNTIAPTITPSPYPTMTATQIPTWIPDFAEPILEAIADRPPDVQEDFSEVGPDWYLEKVNCPNNGCSIVNGALSVVAVPVDGKEAWAVQPFPRFGYKTFVLMVDVNTDALTRENAANIAYEDTMVDNGKFTSVMQYNFELKSERRWFSLIGPSGINGNQWGKLPHSIPPQITFTLISMGDRFAVYLNDIPVIYGEYTGGQYQAGFSLNAWSDGSDSALVEYDNLKIWNLDNIPNLP